MHSQKAMLQEAEPEQGSEGRFGRVEGGRAFFWVGNSPSKNVEVAPSMAWAEDAWQEEGLLGEEAQHLQRLESGDWGMRQGCGGQPVTPPADSPVLSQHREVLGSSFQTLQVAAWSATLAAAPTSCSPAGISHCSTRSAQMHCWLQELLMQGAHSGRALMPVT